MLLGRKLGMTSIFSQTGEYIPCTVIEAGPCAVVQVRSKEKDGYTAVQIGFEDIPERKVSQPQIGHFKKSDPKNSDLQHYSRPVQNLQE